MTSRPYNGCALGADPGRPAADLVDVDQLTRQAQDALADVVTQVEGGGAFDDEDGERRLPRGRITVIFIDSR